MANETSKTNRLRTPEYFNKYLKGRVIDIGCGKDPVTSSAEPYDLIYGSSSAEEILKHLLVESYDCVYSSHCLEHIKDIPNALAQWWALVRPGGFLVLVVPDEDLYEQGFWPSIFNPDHKATFRLNKEISWSPVSWDIRKLVCELPGAEIELVERQDAGYDHSLKIESGVQPYIKRQPSEFNRLLKKILRRLGLDHTKFIMKLERFLGIPVDQTLGNAVAQIQIVARKDTK